MAALLNDLLYVANGKPFSYQPLFDVNVAQGINCGDDGTFSYSALPAGLDYDPVTGRLFGTPQLSSFIVVNLYVNGMDADCENPEVYFTFSLTIFPGPSIFYSRNPMWLRVDGFAGDIRAQFELYCEDSFGSFSYSRLITMELPPDANGGCTFRYNSALDALLESEAERDLPDDAYVAVLHRKSARRFYTRYRFYSPTTGASPWVTQLPATVILGGIPYHEHPTDLTWLTDDFLGGVRGVVLNSRQMLEMREGPLYLTVVANFTFLNSLRYRYYSTSGAERVQDVNLLPTQIKGWFTEAGSFHGVYTIRIDGRPENDELPEFSVELANNSGNSRMGPLDFNIDRSYSPTDRVFVYRNSKGAIETLYCSGLSQSKIEVDRQVGTRLAQPGYTSRQPTSFVFSSNASTSVKVATGWFPDQDSAAVAGQELMLSRAVYELRAGQWVPILVNGKTLQYRQDGDYLTGFNFEYTYGFDTLAPALL